MRATVAILLTLAACKPPPSTLPLADVGRFLDDFRRARTSPDFESRLAFWHSEAFALLKGDLPEPIAFRLLRVCDEVEELYDLRGACRRTGPEQAEVIRLRVAVREKELSGDYPGARELIRCWREFEHCRRARIAERVEAALARSARAYAEEETERARAAPAERSTAILNALRLSVRGFTEVEHLLLP